PRPRYHLEAAASFQDRLVVAPGIGECPAEQGMTLAVFGVVADLLLERRPSLVRPLARVGNVALPRILLHEANHASGFVPVGVRGRHRQEQLLLWFGQDPAEVVAYREERDEGPRVDALAGLGD